MEQEEGKQFGTGSMYCTVWNRKNVYGLGQEEGKQFGTGRMLTVWDRKNVHSLGQEECLSDYNSGTPKPICLKFVLGNSGDPRKCYCS